MRQTRPSGAARAVRVELYETILEVIDMRSFSNLWYWIALASIWSLASHWIIGVPYDMVLRGRRQGGDADADVHMLVRINAGRMLYIARVAGVWIVASSMFMLSGLVMLAVWYRVEFAQAVLCLLLPMMLVWGLTLRTAQRIAVAGTAGPALYRTLLRHRIGVQAIGMVTILFTAMWGMWTNLHVGAL